MARAFIVGAGVVGSATGRGLARHGHEVTFCDIDPVRVDALRAEGWAASTSLDLSGPPAFVFLSVPTPSTPGAGYDLSALGAATSAVGQAIARATSFHTVAVRSTVPPGTCEGVVVPILEETSGKRCGHAFSVASNPEFLRMASADEDFLLPWMTVIGSRSRRTVERLLELLRPFGGEFRTFGTPAEAELVKCAHNLYNAAKISFWNELWRVCEKLGIDGNGISSTVARSAEGSTNPDYGIRGGSPFGGACLPKDTEGFLHFAKELGVPVPLLESVLSVNNALLVEQEARLGAELDLLDLRE